MKLYITFGQDHTHHINSKTFDCNCVAEISCIDYEDGREKAFEFFGPKFATSYDEVVINDRFMACFRRGIIPVEDVTE